MFVPAPAKAYLPVPKSATSVQLVPFQDSVTAVKGCPPKAKADVVVPAPANLNLAVFKSLTSVQLVPFQDSVIATIAGDVPPKAKAAVLVPTPAK